MENIRKKNNPHILLSAKTVVFGFISIVVIASSFVFFLKSLSIFQRFEVMLSFIALSLFLFLLLGLFKGIKLINEDLSQNINKANETTVTEATYNLIDFSFLAADGSISWLIASVIIAVILGIIFGGFSLLFGALSWIFYRVLRLVFIKSKESKGNLILSAKYAFVYTTLYTSWLFGILWLVKLIKQ